MPEPDGYRSTRWLTCFALRGPDAAAAARPGAAALERHSIEARPVWKPMHLQPLFQRRTFLRSRQRRCVGGLVRSRHLPAVGIESDAGAAGSRDRAIASCARAGGGWGCGCSRKQRCALAVDLALVLLAGWARLLAAIQFRHSAGIHSDWRCSPCRGADRRLCDRLLTVAGVSPGMELYRIARTAATGHRHHARRTAHGGHRADAAHARLSAIRAAAAAAALAGPAGCRSGRMAHLCRASHARAAAAGAW